MAEAVPAGNVVVFFFIRRGPLFPQRKAGGPSALRRQQARWPSATGRPLLLAARRGPPCPPQRAGSPPVQGVQGVTPWTPAPPGGGGRQRPFPRAMLSFFSSSATAPFYRSVKPEGLPPSGGNKPGGFPPPGVLYCLQPAAHPLPAPKGGQSAGPGGHPLAPLERERTFSTPPA